MTKKQTQNLTLKRLGFFIFATNKVNIQNKIINES